MILQYLLKIVIKIDEIFDKYSIINNFIYKVNKTLLDTLLKQITSKKIEDYNFEIYFNNKSKNQRKKILLVGNANTNLNKGKEIDSFDGIVGRFNRFQLIDKEFIGRRTNLWIFSEPIVFDERNYYNNNIDRIKKNNPEYNQSILLPRIKDSKELIALREKVEKYEIDVADTLESLNQYIKFISHFQKNAGIVISRDKNFIKKFGYPNPSTGLLSIIYYLNKNLNVHIVNFDFFRTNHYWHKKADLLDSSSIYLNKNVDKVIGDHEFSFEKSLIESLIENNLVKLL